eukprot:SAG25_NODE_250_length_11019_cov_7.950092_3_plen_158_part_00
MTMTMMQGQQHDLSSASTGIWVGTQKISVLGMGPGKRKFLSVLGMGPGTQKISVLVRVVYGKRRSLSGKHEKEISIGAGDGPILAITRPILAITTKTAGWAHPHAWMGPSPVLRRRRTEHGHGGAEEGVQGLGQGLDEDIYYYYVIHHHISAAIIYL